MYSAQKPIPYGKHEITPGDIAAVVEVLQGDFLTQGPTIEKFEQALASYCGSTYALAVANGTVALHLAYQALGLKSGQSIVTTPISFVATANAALYCGAEAVFSDISPHTFNLCTTRLSETLRTHNNIAGIVPVHLAGVPCAMEEISRVARSKNLWVVEDACHAVGSSWHDSEGKVHRVGDCAFSDITVFSFHPVKQLAAGEGGALLTNNKELYDLLLKLRSHGITKNPQLLTRNDGGWYYEMQDLGNNYRITDLQCALALSQLQRLDEGIARRRELVQRYNDGFATIPQLDRQEFNPDDKLSFHLYICQAANRSELYRFLQQKNIYPQVHYIPIYQQPFYQQRYHLNPKDFPAAERYYQHALSLPLYPTLSNAEQDYVIAAVREFYQL